jgi:hypothetical protein
VQKIRNPFAGLTMASLSAAVIRGVRNPFVDDLTSSIAEESGKLPSALMETWAVVWFRISIITAANTIKLLIGFMANVF